jgi:hypothetical protein
MLYRPRVRRTSRRRRLLLRPGQPRRPICGTGPNGTHYRDFNSIENPRHAKRDKHQDMKFAPRKPIETRRDVGRNLASLNGPQFCHGHSGRRLSRTAIEDFFIQNCCQHVLRMPVNSVTRSARRSSLESLSRVRPFVRFNDASSCGTYSALASPPTTDYRPSNASLSICGGAFSNDAPVRASSESP